MTKHLTLNAQPAAPVTRLPNPLPLMHAELLKLKGNGLGLSLLLLGPTLVGLSLALKGMNSSNVKVDVAGLETAWAAPLLLTPVFFLPYLLTLENALGTGKWLSLTPTRSWAITLTKVATALLLSLALSSVCLLAFGGTATLGGLGSLVVTALTSALIFTLLSLLLQNFAAVVVVTFIWTTLAPSLLPVLPEAVRGPLGAALPGLGFNHWSGEYQGVRVAATSFYTTLTAWLMWRQNPKW